MIFRHDIIQGTQDWHEARWAKIGGSSASGLFIKSDTLTMDVLAEYTEQFQLTDGYQSSAMERGNELEPEARYELELYTGLKFIDCGWIQSVDNPLLGISPDGITEDETIHCEIKCPSAKKHIQTCLSDEIPLEHIPQLVHYFTVNSKCEKVYFVSYRPESIKPLFVKFLTLDSKVNIGTKTKPNILTVAEAVKVAKIEAEMVNKAINELVTQLSF